LHLLRRAVDLAWQRGRILLPIVLAMMVMVPSASAAKDARTALLERFGMRVGGGVAFFLSKDQVSWLGFNRPGFLGDLAFSLLVRQWLSVELGGTIGLFMSGAESTGLAELVPEAAAPGGLLAPWLGVRVHGSLRRLVPFFSLNVGRGFTGDLVRAVLQSSVGADVHVGHGASVGPVVGFSQVFQKDQPGASSDARFLWVGLSFTYRSLPPAAPVKEPHTHSVERVVAVQRVVEHDVQREEIYIPAPAPPVDDNELSELLDRALPAPSERVELLAPVLFGFDSDRLEALGVAMLHEVANILKRRTDVELVAIQGYADRRGPAEYNRALATRRARHVKEWLTAHGIAAERLVISEGLNGFVEDGESEPEHHQNRRVIFRVLRLAEPQ
jgi:outer membrane protein OmpA-like peptidoglycan-associated protein